MKRRHFIQSTTLGAGLPLLSSNEPGAPASPEVKRKVFIYGGGRDKAITRHLISLTQKENPKICFLPTATGDNPLSIISWYASCEDLLVRPYVMETFIDSYSTHKSFEETIMSMDAILVGGGNTLNMLSIWKSQGIDLALRKAYEAGIVMSGGSAGSLCWFQNGTTDSRPVKISKIECLGWLKGSHCPHYDTEPTRRPLYHDLIKHGELLPGYACDDKACLYFENEKVVASVASSEKSKSYFVDLVDGKIVEKELTAKLIS
jgi:dipeptidase E